MFGSIRRKLPCLPDANGNVLVPPQHFALYVTLRIRTEGRAATFPVDLEENSGHGAGFNPENLELRDATLAENDWGGAHLLVSENGAGRIARLVLTSCEAFDNYPPGLPGRAVWLATKVPGGLRAMAQPLRVRRLRRLRAL